MTLPILTPTIATLLLLCLSFQPESAGAQYTLLRITNDGTVNNCTCNSQPWDGLSIISGMDNCLTFLLAEGLANTSLFDCKCVSHTFAQLTEHASTATLRPWWQAKDAYLCCSGLTNITEPFHTLLDYARIQALHVLECGGVEPISFRPFVTVYSLNTFITSTRNFTLDPYYYDDSLDQYKEQKHAAFLSTHLLKDAGNLKAFSFLANDTEDAGTLRFDLEEALRRVPVNELPYMFTPIYV